MADYKKFEEYNKCPVCSSPDICTKWEDVKSIDDNINSFTIAHCNNCNVFFIKQKVSSPYLANFYSKNENDDEMVYNNENLNQLNFYYNKLKNYIEKYIPQKGKILDVGCSGGWFLDVMDGWQRYGCEISNYFSNIAKNKYGDNIFQGPIENYNAEECSFDVITLQDCLDHMINPVEIIQKCYKLLKPNGLIVIKAHNTDCLFAKIYGKNFYAVIPPAHLFYFNKKSIKSLLQQNNFKILLYTFIPHLLYFSTIFLRFARGNENSFCYKIYNKLKNNWLGKIGIYKDLHDIFTVFAIKS